MVPAWCRSSSCLTDSVVLDLALRIRSPTKSSCEISRLTTSVVLDSCWFHVGFMLVSCWIHVGFMLVSCWFHVGFMLVSCWVHGGFMLGSCWFHVGFMLDPCWFHVGFLLVSCWFHVGFMSVSCWFHVGFMLGSCWFHVGFMSDSCWTKLLGCFAGIIELRVQRRTYYVMIGCPPSVVPPCHGIPPFPRQSNQQPIH